VVLLVEYMFDSSYSRVQMISLNAANARHA
jgi:hypothetical protein